MIGANIRADRLQQVCHLIYFLFTQILGQIKARLGEV